MSYDHLLEWPDTTWILWTGSAARPTTLYKDKKVSVDNGEPHGIWYFKPGNSDKEMMICFKFNQETIRLHRFERIPFTSCWELVWMDNCLLGPQDKVLLLPRVSSS